MKKIILVSVLSAATGIGAFGCAPEQSLTVESTRQAIEVAATDVGAPIYSYDLNYPSKTASELASTVVKTLDALKISKDGTQLGALTKLLDFAGADYADAEVDSTAGAVSVLYHRAGDVLTITNTEARADVFSTDDIGEEAARNVFKTTFEALSSAGALSGLDTLEPQRATLKRLMQGEGRQDGPRTERLKEYRFYVPRIIDGINVRAGNRDAAVVISVHRDGRVAVVQFAGPQVKRATQLATRTIAERDISDRAAKDFPSHAITPLGLLLFSGDSVSEQVAPRQAYFVSLTSQIDGRTIHARGQVISYSVTNSSDAFSQWPIPQPLAQGDARPKSTP